MSYENLIQLQEQRSRKIDTILSDPVFHNFQ